MARSAKLPASTGSGRSVKARKGRARDTAAEQRRRLFEGMATVVSSSGYPAATIKQVVKAAGVSKRDFYVHFESKEDCFLQAFYWFLDEFAAAIEAAASEHEGDVRNQVIAVIEVVARIIATEPEAVSLVLVDSLTIGPSGVEARQRSQEVFEAMLRAGFRQVPGGRQLAEVKLRGIVIGMRRTVYQTIRDRNSAKLRAAAPAMADWALAYVYPADPPRIPASGGTGARGVRRPGPTRRETPPLAPGPDDLEPRERIAAAAVELCWEAGYGSLKISSISTRARVSNATFYQHFDSKQEALLVGF